MKTGYQIKITTNTYFNTLMDNGIPESEVENWYEKDGILHILLKNKKIIKEKIKNYK